MKVYAAGHCLTRGSQMQRQKEREELDAVASDLEWYIPQDNKEINDKATAIQEGLAERIVKHDTDAIFWSDTVVIEPLPEALGTHVELGQLKGIKDTSVEILRIIERNTDPYALIMEIAAFCSYQVEREVYPHYEDIRRFDGVTESEDRRSLGINQYIYGVCLDLSRGKGFYEWEDIKREISNQD